MLLAGLTLLPALLAIFGRAVFWPSKTVPREHREGAWGRIAGRLVQRPALTLSHRRRRLRARWPCAPLGFKSGGFGGKVTAPAGTRRGQGQCRADRPLPPVQHQPDQRGHALPDVGVVQTPQPPGRSATRGLEQTRRLHHAGRPPRPQRHDPHPASSSTPVHEELGVVAPRAGRRPPRWPPPDSTVPPALYDAYRGRVALHRRRRQDRPVGGRADSRRPAVDSRPRTPSRPIRHDGGAGGHQGRGHRQRRGRRGAGPLRREQHLRTATCGTSSPSPCWPSGSCWPWCCAAWWPRST